MKLRGLRNNFVARAMYVKRGRGENLQNIVGGAARFYSFGNLGFTALAKLGISNLAFCPAAFSLLSFFRE